MRQDPISKRINRRIRGTCFAGYYWLTGRRSLLSFVEYLDRFHFATRSEIDAQVHRNMFRLLSHAARNVPYYRDLVNIENLSESTAISFLRSFPILTKNIIRSESKRLISKKPGRRAIWNTSGGSTGEPVRLLQDLSMKTHSRATELLSLQRTGHKFGEPHVLIWGVPEATFNERVSLHERFFRLVHNETYLNCYRITDDVFYTWIECINIKCPTVIEAYADAIYELSRFIIREGIYIESPRAIITSAGVLESHMKETINQALNCPIINRYGSREVGSIACSCLSSNELHLEEYTSYVEIVDDKGNPCEVGVEGNILVTLLTNYTMPLIRYQIEDRGIWASGPCPCGRRSKQLAGISGRQGDYLVASDGTKINGTALTTLLYPVSTIKRYQYRQIHKDKVILTVEPSDGVDMKKLQEEMQSPLEKLKVLLSGLSVQLAIVDEISPSKSGKYRYVLNEFAQK